MSFNLHRQSELTTLRQLSAKRAAFMTATLALLVVLLFTRVIGNGLMLIMDRENFLPKEASIFTLAPFVIKEGSSSYWLYAEDSTNYYHFTYKPGREYLLMRKDQSCPGFKKEDVTTWCNTKVGSTSGTEQ